MPLDPTRRLILSIVLFFITPILVASEPLPGYPDKLGLVHLLRENKLDELDGLIQGYQRAYEAGAFDESQLAAAYFAFADSSADLEKHLNLWIRKMPSSFSARMARGVYLWNLGILTRGPRSGLTMSDEHYKRFQTYFADSGIDLIEALQQRGQLGIAYSLLIHMSSDLGESSDILELARRGAKADPFSVSVHRRFLDSQRPWVTKTNEDPEFAVKRIQRYVDNLASQFPDTPHISALGAYPTLVRADLMVRRGDREGAMALYDKAIAFDHWIYAYRRGVNHFRLHAFELALNDFDRALNERPQAAEILNMKARTLRALGRWIEADNTWAKAIALNPRDPKLLFHRARALRDDRDFVGAKDALTLALELGHYSPHIWDARGRIYLYDLQQFAKAVSDLEKPLAYAPESQRYWFNYATALYKKKDCEAIPALRYYLKLCELRTCPADSIVWTQAWSDALDKSNMCRPPTPLAETQHRGSN